MILPEDLQHTLTSGTQRIDLLALMKADLQSQALKIFSWLKKAN